MTTTNSLYNYGRQGFLDGSIDWDTHDIKAVLVDLVDYTHDPNHMFLSSVDSGARVATSSNFTSKTVASGIADADDITFSSVTGDSCEALIIYRDTGNEATSELIMYVDDAVGLPVNPNGGNINVTWSDGASKIFKL